MVIITYASHLGWGGGGGRSLCFRDLRDKMKQVSPGTVTARHQIVTPIVSCCIQLLLLQGNLNGLPSSG